MIGLHDRLELPLGVGLTEGGLADEVRGVTLPVNATGRALVRSRSLAEMAERCVTQFGTTHERAHRDVLVFALDLNRRYLVNVRVRGGPVVVAMRWLRAAVVLARHGDLPRWPARRRALDTTSRRRAAIGAASGSLAPGAAAAALALAAPVAVGLPPALALSAGVAIAVGVAVHEAGHAAVLRGVPAFVATRAARVAVVHRPLPARRTARVAVAGPVAGTAYALMLALGGWLLTSAELAVGAVTLAPQAIALTAVAQDGRRACEL